MGRFRILVRPGGIGRGAPALRPELTDYRQSWDHPTMTDVQAFASPSHRQSMDELVTFYITHGWRVESRIHDTVVLVKGHRINHLLHLVLTLLTVGLWGLFVWLPLSIFAGERRRTLTPADLGRFHVG